MNLRTSVLAAGGAVLSLAGASPAAASELFRDGDALVLRGSPGEVNVFGTSLDKATYGSTRIHFYDRTSHPMAVDPALGCETTSTGFGQFANCPQDGVAKVRLEGEDGVDTLTMNPYDYPLTGNAVTLDGGAGNDQIEAPNDAPPLTIRGGDGDDTIKGGTGPDVVDGGPGNDAVDGRDGADTVLGGAGDDLVKGGPDVSADVIDGGPGRDSNEGDWSSSSTLAVTFDGAANDGRPGENDNVISVEAIRTTAVATLIAGEPADSGVRFEVYRTTAGSSRLVGSRFDDYLRTDHYDDAIEGGAGADAIDAGFGNDTINPGPGPDTVLADGGPNACEYGDCPLPFGNDTIDARDGERDSIDCGVGTDTVLADAVDVLANCEQSADDPAGPALNVTPTSLRRALSRGLRVTVTGVSGRVALKATRRGRTLARGARTAADGEAVVVLRFTKAAKRRLRTARTLRLRISGANISQVVRLKRGARASLARAARAKSLIAPLNVTVSGHIRPGSVLQGSWNVYRTPEGGSWVGENLELVETWEPSVPRRTRIRGRARGGPVRTHLVEVPYLHRRTGGGVLTEDPPPAGGTTPPVQLQCAAAGADGPGSSITEASSTMMQVVDDPRRHRVVVRGPVITFLGPTCRRAGSELPVRQVGFHPPEVDRTWVPQGALTRWQFTVPRAEFAAGGTFRFRGSYSLASEIQSLSSSDIFGTAVTHGKVVIDLRVRRSATPSAGRHRSRAATRSCTEPCR